MNILKILLGILVLLVVSGGILVAELNRQSDTTKLGQEITGKVTNSDCIPTFVDGGGPYYKPNSPFRYKIVPEENSGETLTVWGKILQNDCQTPVSNAVLDIWQADETGSYQDEWYRGQVRSDENGNYSFETVAPKGYGSGTGYRPPHIHFKIWINNQEIITSQMFFPEVRGREGFEDAYIMDLTTETVDGRPVYTGYHDIILP